MIQNEIKTKKPKDKLSFVDTNPEAYTLLQCLRKSLIIDEKFQLKCHHQFFLNENEFKFFGHKIETLKLGRVTQIRSGHYKIILDIDVVKRIKYIVSKIHFTLR